MLLVLLPRGSSGVLQFSIDSTDRHRRTQWAIACRVLMRQQKKREATRYRKGRAKSWEMVMILKLHALLSTNRP